MHALASLAMCRFANGRDHRQWRKRANGVGEPFPSLGGLAVRFDDDRARPTKSRGFRGGFGRKGDQSRLKPRERSEEHTSELQSLMRNSYAVFRLKKNNHTHKY